jgi:hypothetical protein
MLIIKMNKIVGYLNEKRSKSENATNLKIVIII